MCETRSFCSEFVLQFMESVENNSNQHHAERQKLKESNETRKEFRSLITLIGGREGKEEM